MSSKNNSARNVIATNMHSLRNKTWYLSRIRRFKPIALKKRRLFTTWAASTNSPATPSKRTTTARSSWPKNSSRKLYSLKVNLKWANSKSRSTATTSTSRQQFKVSWGSKSKSQWRRWTTWPRIMQKSFKKKDLRELVYKMNQPKWSFRRTKPRMRH